VVLQGLKMDRSGVMRVQLLLECCLPSGICIVTLSSAFNHQYQPSITFLFDDLNYVLIPINLIFCCRLEEF